MCAVSLGFRTGREHACCMGATGKQGQRATPAQHAQTVNVGGHRLTLTHLDKVLYPETGTTKADVLGYYAEIADLLIAHAAHRPATRKRWVHGVGTAEHPESAFFQKNVDDATPSWVSRRSIQHSDHVNEYPLVNNLATLTWLGQIAALEIHVPQWQFGRGGAPRNPDRLVLDLDPGEGAGLAECAEVARYARAILRAMGLDPVPVTSGSKGIHLYAALNRRQTSAQVADVAHELARALEADHPDLIVSGMSKALRPGKVFVDWSQNNAAKTTITPYSLRGRAHPFVAAPRTWGELKEADLAQLDYRQVLKRVKRRGDPLVKVSEIPLTTDVSGWAPWVAAPDPPAADPLSADALSAAPLSADPLTDYRSKRSSARTPEPIPPGVPPPTSGHSFVIHEHHARALHFDLRLEHDGVLVSWALPKGVPTEMSTNHLAVRTENHPLEYGDFEGTIPAGAYGAGEIRIWDSGDYELEKWRDTEVIVTLHGAPDGGLGGSRRFALIKTAGSRPTDANWLIHLMKPAGEATNSTTPPAGAPGFRTSRHPAALPRPTTKRYSPMLATPGGPLDVAQGRWAFEMKWDGIRAVGYLSRSDTAHSVRFFTRNGNDVTASYPELVDSVLAAVDPTVGSAVLDGEIVALDATGRPDFGVLQTRMKLTEPIDVRAAAGHAPVRYLVFDLLELAEKPLVQADYDTRRQQLDAVLTSTDVVQAPPAFLGDLASAMSASRQFRLEGVMAKERESPYAVGRRSRSWIKLKLHLTQEVVIGGWRPGKGQRAGLIGSLLLGIPDGELLRYVGRVGTGFRDRELIEIAQRLEPLADAESPFADVPDIDAHTAKWVRPHLVGEVEFADWTAARRLRHPTWRGWRPDKSPPDVVAES
jgi:bifunctional non-homologous end joining protein LigD